MSSPGKKVIDGVEYDLTLATSQRPKPEPDAKNVTQNINRAYVAELADNERLMAALKHMRGMSHRDMVAKIDQLLAQPQPANANAVTSAAA